ncbi:MAG: DUF4389 domain-containing protein, partial [Acidimicrobiales bacterium]
MRPAKVVSVVVGSLAALLALGLAVGGTALVLLHATQRDGDGYYRTSTERFETPTYALTSERVDLSGDWPGVGDMGTARVVARSVGGPVFVGIARPGDVERYLAGTARDELTDVDLSPFRATLERHPGERPPAPPGEQTIWAAAASGPGRQSAAVELGRGEWTAVVMNADASPGIEVDASVGVETGLLLPVGVVLLVASALSAALAAVLIVVGLRRGGGPAHGEPGAAAA